MNEVSGFGTVGCSPQGAVGCHHRHSRCLNGTWFPVRELHSQAIETTLANTGGALAGSALTTVAGFGILVTSTTIPFRQFGFVTAYTILLAMLAAVLVLPSMLVLWDRWHASRDAEVERPTTG